MDDNRIKPVSPSLARLKYESNRKGENDKKKDKPKKNSHKSTEDSDNIFDDFA